MRVGEDADLAVGQHQAAHQIVLQITLDRAPEGFFRQTPPRFPRNVIAFEPPFEFIPGDQRFEH